ncbi:hypothetical protein F4818DRAFT_304635 [Hypoxylon cercidicola]|nr:hypothetical protein F4818DRAFT_304635 [Hypoxylon cercidicola]
MSSTMDQLLPKSTCPYIKDQKVISHGKYQGLATVFYVDPRDETETLRERDFIFLVGRPRLDPVGTLMPNIYQDDDGRWYTIVVQQFRPQYEADTIEFPAGFISRRSGGETAEQAAVREMEEETTKTGTVIMTSPKLTSEPVPIAARLTGVYLHVVDKQGLEAGKQRLDKGEFAVEWKIPLLELEAKLLEFERESIVIDPRIWTFAMGIQCAISLDLHKAASKQ